MEVSQDFFLPLQLIWKEAEGLLHFCSISTESYNGDLFNITSKYKQINYPEIFMMVSLHHFNGFVFAEQLCD